jgi:hypothetical protein
MHKRAHKPCVEREQSCAPTNSMRARSDTNGGNEQCATCRRNDSSTSIDKILTNHVLPPYGRTASFRATKPGLCVCAPTHDCICTTQASCNTASTRYHGVHPPLHLMIRRARRRHHTCVLPTSLAEASRRRAVRATVNNTTIIRWQKHNAK